VTDLATPTKPLSKPRLVIGIVVAAVAAVLATLFVLGVVNPWRLVVLKQYFGVPTRGFVIVMVLTGAALLLLTPVRSEAKQRGRTVARAVVVVLLAVGLICWGVQPNLLGAQTRVLAKTADEGRQVAIYEYGGDDRELIVWEGKGWAARERGSLGRPCGATFVTFLTRDRVEVTTVYGIWQLNLDPATGEPVDHLGPTCSG